jgi:hypothetical protein
MLPRPVLLQYKHLGKNCTIYIFRKKGGIVIKHGLKIILPLLLNVYPGVNWIYVLVMYCIDFSTQSRELKHEPAAFYKGRHSTGGLCTPSSGFRTETSRLSPWAGRGNANPDHGVTFVTFPFVNVTVEILQLVNRGDKYCTSFLQKIICVAKVLCLYCTHVCANLPIMLKSQTRVYCAGIFIQSMGARNRVGIGLSYHSPYL